jgi:hypothetical protein
MVALSAKQARKMTKVASALPTPNQPSRDHEVVTQRLPEGDRPRGSRGVRTRHGGTKLGGRNDRSGWGGGGRRHAAAGAAGPIVIAATDAGGLDSALKHSRLMMTGSVQTDNGRKRDGGASRVPCRLGGGNGGVPKRRRTARASPKGKLGRDAELPNRKDRDAPRGRVGHDARRGGRGVELGGVRGRHPASGEDMDVTGPVKAG